MTTTDGPLSLPALLRLLQLASPALPVGAFAYSQGLEPAVHAGWVRDEATAAAWLGGLLAHSLQGLEVPLFARLYPAWRADDAAGVDAGTRSCTRPAATASCRPRNAGWAPLWRAC